MVINVRSNVYVNMTSGLPDVGTLTRLMLQSAWVWMVEITGTGMGIMICAVEKTRNKKAMKRNTKEVA